MRSLISIDFPAPKMEPESAHVVSAVSVHWLQCSDCDAARPRQHSPILCYSALLRYSVLLRYFTFPHLSLSRFLLHPVFKFILYTIN